MGSKGQSTTQQATNQSQTQTYAPNAQAAGYLTNALQQGANAASLPFNIPQAPVAGFSQDQQNAFGLVNQAQGQAQPYYNQAANYFSPQGTQQFLNPYVDSVTANLNDIFGQQQSQTTGQLTQAAGGVGADRIAVGQADLAKQQGLAAGQTYSQLYNNAAQQAQAAGYGSANIGQASQNSALQGAQALLGTGGLQQQLSQAQLNSPYQQQLAQAAFPYQQAQFLAGITGALAPGLGGTTSGQSYGTSNGTSTPAQPSIWSQLLGAGVAGAGLYGGLGGSQSAYNPFASLASYGGGNALSGDAYGGNASNPLPGLSASDYAARGGAINPYAGGGEVSDDPIDVSKAFSIPKSQIQPIQARIPQLQFSQPQQPQQSGNSGGKGGGLGDILGSAVKIGAMFANRGGAVDPYNAATGYALGGAPEDDAPATFDERFPFRMPGTAAVDRWRDSVDATNGDALPNVITGKPPAQDATALSFAAPSAGDAALPENAQPTAGQGNPFAPTPAAGPENGDAGQDFAKSPWAALTAAGLGIMGGTSPFAGVNIGQGAQQGLKALQTQRETAQKDTTIEQSAKRLEQEAKFHEDQFTRETMAQRNSREQADRPYEELTKAQQAQLEESRRQHDLARIPQGFQRGDNGLEPIPGGPHDPKQITNEAVAKRGPGMTDEALEPLVDSYMKGNTGVLTGVGRGTQGAQNLEKFWSMTAKKLAEQGKTGGDLAAARANFMAQSAGARVAAQRESTVESAVNEAKGTFPLVLAASEKLSRTDYPLVNQAIQAYRTNTGSPEQRKYGAAIQASITAYSQAMSRTGGNSVFAQQHAEALFNRGIDGPEALKATIEQLQAEMAIAQHAPEETRQAILQRIIGGTDKAAAVPAGGAPAAPAKTLAPQDQQALDWAKANPSDPRAAAIRQRLGVQ